jgi:HEAT repeat protein
MELGMFVSEIVKQGEVDDSLLTYYRSQGANLDDSHLEMVLLLLGKLGTRAAVNEVARFLDHPTKYVRYQAAQVITSVESLDENAMGMVIKVLANPSYPEDITHLEEVLDRGATESARLLAKRFREGKRTGRC